MSAKTTMAMVARALGVHQTTVSLALRGHPSIPGKTRERVRRQAEKMGYRPNPMVSALMVTRRRGKARGLHSRLALLTTGGWREDWRDGSPNYARLYQALVKRAEARGYGVEEFWLNDPGTTPERLRRILLQRGMRGAIVVPMIGGQKEVDFDFSDFATVAMRYTLQSPALDRVSIDYAAGMRLAVERLREAGYRRIGFATSRNVDRRVSRLSLGAYLAARFENPRLFPEPTVQEDWTRESIRKWAASARADAVIVPTVMTRDVFCKALPKVPVFTLDCHVDSAEPGVLQDADAEARAAIELVTGRVERAEFGLPERAQTVLISGSWRDATAGG